MYNFIDFFNKFMLWIFFICYSYQMYYLFLPFLKKVKLKAGFKKHRFAIIIAARNEEKVIANLINSLKKQKYDNKLFNIYLVADNCTDSTAKKGRELGVHVIERFDKEKVGKGFALDYAIKHINEDYDAILVFDADNIVDANFVNEMNKMLNNGYKASTSYRNSTNYDYNWISAGYGLWFLRESKYLNHSRMINGTSCAISGTGFMISKEILDQNGGWIHHLLTEDIEFSIDSVIKGIRIGYCPTAIIYDEQPITFKQSWNQRMRWSKGFYQVFHNYGWKLWKTCIKKHSFSCYDMFMTVSPAMLVTILSIMINGLFLLAGFQTHSKTMIDATTASIFSSIVNYYIVLWVFGFITTITEWSNIQANNFKKILYTFSFPIFMLTYIPIAIVALFSNVEWKPIEHGNYSKIVVNKINQMK